MKLFRIPEHGIEPIPERSYRDREAGGFGDDTLQKYLADHPELIPGGELNPTDAPKFLTLRREAGVIAGSEDILLDN